MYEHLKAAVPDGEVLIDLEPEELGSKILFAWRKSREARETLTNLVGLLQQRGAYSDVHHARVAQAISEAWSWLEVQGLIVTDYSQPGGTAWRILSRKAQSFVSDDQFADFAMAKALSREILHPAIRDQVWRHFVRGEYDIAVQQAMKRVEIAVREACGWSDDDIGVPMVRRAFHKDDGPLADQAAVVAEREARLALFAGAIGAYKSPQGHRDVNLNHPVEAIEIIMLASHLLRVVDTRRSANEARRDGEA